MPCEPLVAPSISEASSRLKPDGVLGAVPIGPRGDDAASVIERMEVVLPNAFFFEGAMNRSTGPFSSGVYGGMYS